MTERQYVSNNRKALALEMLHQEDSYRNPTLRRNRSQQVADFRLPTEELAFGHSRALPLTSPLGPADGGIRVPAPLDEPYGLHSWELGEGSLNRLLLLHSAMASSLRVSPLGLPPGLSASPSGPLACV